MKNKTGQDQRPILQHFLHVKVMSNKVRKLSLPPLRKNNLVEKSLNFVLKL
jgi:hypothetical protein